MTETHEYRVQYLKPPWIAVSTHVTLPEAEGRLAELKNRQPCRKNGELIHRRIIERHTIETICAEAIGGHEA